MSASESGSASDSGSEGPPPSALPGSSTTPFEKISCLGEGAFGAVWLARCRSSGSYVALKEVGRQVADPLLLEPERDVLREIAEAKKRSSDSSGEANLVSPALAGLVATFVTPFAVCMAMDLVEGTHLQDHLRAEGPMKEERAQWYTAELAGGLEWLHQAGWLYRDLKLTNVMLSLSEGSYGRVKLIDFGFALHGLWSDKALGTLQTMAPEVIACAKADWVQDLGLADPGYGPTADWWSLGAVLFELLTGDAPFGRHDDILLEGLKVLRAQQSGLVWPSEVSDEAKVAALSLCQMKPTERPSTVAALKQYAFFASLDWQAVMSTASGPSFKPLGFTIASASEERLRPRRGPAMPPALDGPDPFENF
eukprot:Skav216788  [mRNA]  locus=scaffold1384:80340:81437:+ [translate_table: standard]